MTIAMMMMMMLTLMMKKLVFIRKSIKLIKYY